MKQPLKRLLNLLSTDEYTARILDGDLLSDGSVHSECRTALDLGCGIRSPLKRYRYRLNLVGLDASQDVLNEARRIGSHDSFIKADLTEVDPVRLEFETDVEKFDLVALCDVIEHLPRTAGIRLFDSVETLTFKYVLIETPNGFRAQGPEYGNPHQRHLSGWFVEDFEARGYTIFGNGALVTSGTMRGRPGSNSHFGITSMPGFQPY